jgi:acetylornithine deacetylase
LKGEGGGKSIILNGHIDVVPEGDRTKWSDDPFSGITKEGRMYGRGTTDMKGGNVAMIYAVEAIIKSGIKLKGDVIFQSVIEEESGGAGTLATVQRGYKADAAIIPEPTNMKLFIKQQGSLWFRITVEGLSAHGGTRYEGVSAIEKAWTVHRAILQLESNRNKNINDPLFDSIPIPIPINVGKIEGGSWPSSVPDIITMEGRLGVGPEEQIDDAKKAMQDCLENLSSVDEWFDKHPVKLEFFGAQWVPNAVNETHSFVELVKENFENLFQKKVKVEASPWGTDAGILGAAGGIPAIVIGPGETKVAHFPDEFIELEEMIKAARLFAITILKWCEVA